MFELWNYLKACLFGNKLKLVDELIEIIEAEEAIAKEETTPKAKKTRKKKTNDSTN